MLNKRIIIGAGVCAIAVLLLLWVGLRQHWFGGSPHVESAVMLGITVLGFPLRLYVAFVMGEAASWSFPVLVLLLGFTGVFWGLVTERLVWFLKRRGC